MPIKPNREYRDMVLTIQDAPTPDEPREDEEKRMIVEGYASTFNEPYTLYSDDEIIMREQVAPGAFDNTDMSDVIMQYNHEGRVFARTTNETLRVDVDEVGLHIAADLSGTEIGRNLYEEIRGRYTDKMSFGFTVSADEWADEKADDGRDVVTRTITGVGKLYDVSAVSIPANNATSISVRNLADGVIERVRTERSEREALELAKRKAEARLKAIMLKGVK